MRNKAYVYIDTTQAPAELKSMLKTLREEYFCENSENSKITFEKLPEPGALKVEKRGDDIVISYGSHHCAARGLGLALANVECTENTCFESLGIMLDCSRGAVMTVEHIKSWLRQLTLMGYNMLMLYTEDTYLLPNEPYFGYMRGSYSQAEVREIDDYAAALGIELIPCIQTLGHLEQPLNWSAYDKIKDTASVMFVDKTETYAIIDKMLEFWSGAVRSRRIHIGMDETHDLGRGKFMDEHGFERGFDIFNRHLDTVVKQCAKHGLEAMIWSDMYFRMSNARGDYYDMNSSIPEDVRKAIPEKANLVYWDYYHDNKEFYMEWIRRHRELGKEPMMGSGVWTWSRLWYDHQKTESTVRPCIAACRESKLKELMFTMWGDDGAYCDFDSSLAGLCWSAELSFGGSEDPEKLEKQFSAVSGGSYKEHMLISNIEQYKENLHLTAPPVIWDDPLLCRWFRELTKVNNGLEKQLLENYRSIMDQTATFSFDSEAGDIEHAFNIASTMTRKIDYQIKLMQAYEDKDHAALKTLVTQDIPVLINSYRTLSVSFRRQWMRKFKPFGLEVIQSRFATQIARLEEAALRLTDLTEQRINSIPELEKMPLSGKQPEGMGYKKCAFTMTARW
jgi:hypothetical protein